MPDALTINAEEQWRLFRDAALDPRGRIPTGIPQLDKRLKRGGFAPGEFIILAGVTGTRKTALTMNLVRNILNKDFAVGLIGLDERTPSYTAKLASVFTSKGDEDIEEQIIKDGARHIKEVFEAVASKFTQTQTKRLSIPQLTQFCEMADHTPEIVFIDYLSLLHRGKYDGGDVKRIPRLVEDLQVWSGENEVVVCALHQVGRMDEGVGARYHGATPMTERAMKFGGEEIADITLATYRPAKDPIGNKPWEEVKDLLPKKTRNYDPYDDWQQRSDRVKKFWNSTFLQLLKNRPGKYPDIEAQSGFELVSPNESQLLVPAGHKFNEQNMQREA